MRLRQKIIVLAVLPLVIAVLVIAALVAVQTRALARQEAALLEESMLAAKRTELRHYVELAQTAIAHIYESGRDDPLAREEVKRILNTMSFGEDGYFFAYDAAGRLARPFGRGLVDVSRHAILHPRRRAAVLTP